MYRQYVELREALVAVNESLNGRVPTLLDFLPLQDVGTAFLPAATSARTYVDFRCFAPRLRAL